MDVFESNEVSSLKSNLPGGIGFPEEETVPKVDDRIELLDCCKKTIKQHAANNPMMVCSDCKQIIKCFDDEKAFRNYQRFCASRHRRILATSFEDRLVVVFRSYDTYST
ncbi:MAG: hypothetical protein ACOH5I_15935 [Oligoflexus sp.]